MSGLDEFSPEDIPDTPVEMLLDSLGLGVMRNNISQQIKGAISSQQNFLSIVIEKFERIDQNIEDNDARREIQLEIISFCKNLILEIVGEYNLFYDDNPEDSKEVIEILSVLYNFFVLRNKENVCNFLVNYIKENKNILMNSIGDGNEVDNAISDITTISYEKKNIPEDHIWLLSHVNAIIDFICRLDIEPVEFLSTINDGDFYIERLLEYFEEDRIGGDFVLKYINDIVDDYSSSKSTETRNSVRVALLQ